MNSTLKNLQKRGETFFLADRKVIVCIRSKCRTTSPNCRYVPEECPFGILHSLETIDGTTWSRERRTGKTTELIGLANEAAAAGYPVYYLTTTEDMAWIVKQMFMTTSMVNVMSFRSALTRLRGEAPGIVVVDEVTPDEMKEVKRKIIETGNHFLLAHY